ncbi:MAG: archease [Candidatus Diapherotrites archaeon]|nr:archease [Candidatus Diapherotrites archaeon]
MATYTFLEHTADVMFKAKGKTLEGLFEESAKAVFEVLVKPQLVWDGIEEKINVSATTPEKLLHDWLSELLYASESKFLVFNRFAVKITRKENNNFELFGSAFGEKINQEKHCISSEIKAVSYYGLEIKKEGEGYTVKIILDV